MSTADSRNTPTRRGDRSRPPASPEAWRDPSPAKGGGEDSVLPPGQRDANGFWTPAGYSDPRDLFSPQQRSLQAKQREAHRQRRRPPIGEPDGPAGSR